MRGQSLPRSAVGERASWRCSSRARAARSGRVGDARRRHVTSGQQRGAEVAGGRHRLIAACRPAGRGRRPPSRGAAARTSSRCSAWRSRSSARSRDSSLARAGAVRRRRPPRRDGAAARRRAAPRPPAPGGPARRRTRPARRGRGPARWPPCACCAASTPAAAARGLAAQLAARVHGRADAQVEVGGCPSPNSQRARERPDRRRSAP